MRRVYWAEAAVADLRRFREYDAEFSDGTPQIVIDRTILATDWLLDWPSARRPVGGSGWRKWKSRRTAHVLIYGAIPDGIGVGRVRHERENWRTDL